MLLITGKKSRHYSRKLSARIDSKVIGDGLRATTYNLKATAHDL